METSNVIHNKCDKGGRHPWHSAHSPVNADSAQVENTGSAHHHIQRDKDITVEPVEKPGTADHLHKTGRQINKKTRKKHSSLPCRQV